MGYRNSQKRVDRIKRHLSQSRSTYESKSMERLDLPFVQFVALMPYMIADTVKALAIIPPPKTFCKRDVPQDLQLVTFGMLTELQGAPVDNDYIKTCCKLVSVLTGVDEKIVASRRAYDVLGIVNMIQSEMERIGKLFQSLHTDHSSDEVNAGIDKLNFGAFGIVDWYAQRMSIIDHEEVFKTPWARIFQCMRIDHENNEFEKRYRKILEQRAKRK